MISELLTPLILATAPIAVVVPEIEKYNHETQTVVHEVSHEIVAQFSPIGGPRTASGTRTYDYRGNPNDADND